MARGSDSRDVTAPVDPKNVEREVAAKAEPRAEAKPEPAPEPAQKHHTENRTDAPAAREEKAAVGGDGPSTSSPDPVGVEGREPPGRDLAADVEGDPADPAVAQAAFITPEVYGETDAGRDPETGTTFVEQSMGVDAGARHEVYQRHEHGPEGTAIASGARLEAGGIEHAAAEAGLEASAEDGVGAYTEVRTVTHTVRQEAGIDADEEGVEFSLRNEVRNYADQPVTAQEATVDVDTDGRDGDVGVTAGVREENALGHVGDHIEAEARHETADDGSATTTVGIEGRHTSGYDKIEGGARHTTTTSEDGSETEAHTRVGGSITGETVGVEGYYERTTETDGDNMSDSTTVGGGVDAGAHEYSAERTTSHERTDDSETTGNRVDVDYRDDAGGSAGFGFEHTEKLTETDERPPPSELDQLAGMAMGHGGAVPQDHDTTTRIEGHVGDAEASAEFNEGQDFDGVQGEGWTGIGIGADYTREEWSSTDVTVGEHEAGHYERYEETLDRNPLDGDLEDSSSYERGVYVDDVEVRYHNEDYARTDINPLDDGEVSHESGGSQGIEVNETEVSTSGSARTEADVNPLDGRIGVEHTAEREIVVGDREVSQSSESEAWMGVGGAGVESRVGIEANEDASAGASGRAEVDTDMRDGDIGASAGAETSYDVGIVEAEAAVASETSVGPGGIESETSAGVSVGGIGGASAEAHHHTDTDASDGDIGSSTTVSHQVDVLGATVGGSAGASMEADAEKGTVNQTVEAELDDVGSFEASAGTDGLEASGSLLGVTVGAQLGPDGAGIAVDNDGDGESETVGELVDDAIDGAGDAADAIGDGIEDAAEAVGEGISDMGEAIDDFFSGDDDSDDDEDDEDDDSSTVGEMIDDWLGGFG